MIAALKAGLGLLIAALAIALAGSPEVRSAADAEPPLEVQRGLRYGSSERLLLDVHRPAGSGAAPAVMMVHGGAWRAGSRRRMEPVARAIARAGFVAISVDYTLATRRRAGFPRQVRQLRAAVRWVRRNATRLGVDGRRIGAFGISAGGHLAALLALDARGPLTVGHRVGAVAAWSAPFRLGSLRAHPLGSAVARFLGCAWRGCPGRRVAAASPTTHASPDDPPMLLMHSRRELVPLGQARSMARRLRSAGAPRLLRVFPGAEHGRTYADRAIGPTVAFLRRRLR